MNVINTLLLIGALHGVIMGGLLWHQKVNRQKNQLLAAVVIILGLENWGTYCFTAGLVGVSRWYYYSSFSLLFALGPVLYLYTVCIIEDKVTWKKRYLLHLAPLLIQVADFQSYYFFNPRLSLFDLNFGDLSKIITQYGTAISVFVYLYACRKLIQSKHSSYVENPSKVRYTNYLGKIYGILMIVNCSWCVYLVCRSFDLAVMLQFSFYGLHVLLSFLIYWMAIEGYLIHRDPVGLPRRQKTKRSAEDMEQVSDQLERIRQRVEGQQIYLQPDLTLELLAQNVGVHHKTLSHLINQHFNLNFNDFINQYRVQEAQRRLVNPQYSHLTIEGIGQEVGFTSKTTFNRAFKAFSNMTAKEYIKSQHPSRYPV
jgi:AraC-like DNA-binding protein